MVANQFLKLVETRINTQLNYPSGIYKSVLLSPQIFLALLYGSFSKIHSLDQPSSTTEISAHKCRALGRRSGLPAVHPRPAGSQSGWRPRRGRDNVWKTVLEDLGPGGCHECVGHTSCRTRHPLARATVQDGLG